MKKFFYFTMATVLLISGCSTSEKVSNAENKIVVNKTVNSNVNQPNANVEVAVNTNADKVTLGDASISKKNARNWEGKNLGSKENVPIADKLEKIVTAAPDNSEVSSQMNEKGQPVETRTFKKHPLLLRVERIDLNKLDTKVYLKNGKIFNMPEDKADKFLTASAAEILAAIGVGEK